MKNFIIIAFISLLLAGVASCATKKLPAGHVYMRQGTMISLSDGSEIPIEVQGTGGSIYPEGLMLAINPANREIFRGKYYLVSDGPSSVGTIQNVWGTQTGQITTTSTNRYLRGIMKGSQGSIMNVNISVGKINSNYFGEASDAKGGKYQINLSPRYITKDVR